MSSAGAIDDLVASARDARAHAYAPYSGFPVGAAVLSAGSVYAGVNVENASFPLSVCAERNAVAAAVSAGHTTIEAVAVVGSGADPTPPCGGCRQVLREFGPHAVVVAEGLGGRRTEWTVADLLPSSFGPESLT